MTQGINRSVQMKLESDRLGRDETHENIRIY